MSACRSDRGGPALWDRDLTQCAPGPICSCHYGGVCCLWRLGQERIDKRFSLTAEVNRELFFQCTILLLPVYALTHSPSPVPDWPHAASHAPRRDPFWMQGLPKWSRSCTTCEQEQRRQTSEFGRTCFVVQLEQTAEASPQRCWHDTHWRCTCWAGCGGTTFPPQQTQSCGLCHCRALSLLGWGSNP
jgi:hypothetical protein